MSHSRSVLAGGRLRTKLPGLVGEGRLPLAPQRIAGGEPSAFEVSPRFAYPQFGGITGRVRFA